MLTLRHHRTERPAWQAPPVCAEFRGSGIELQLIDAVDALERAESAGSPDRTALALQVRRLQDELIALSA
jgi:hypothetical protein